jgi:RNA polymerase sigma-70 factor (ECF subfamily)
MPPPTSEAADTSLAEHAHHLGPRLRRYALSLLGDPEAARDAVADVTARCCAIGPTDSPQNPSAYLFTAVRNRCLDVRRKEKRMTPLTDGHALRLTAAEPDPATQAEQGDESRRALSALDDLPPAQQEVLRLKFSGGLSYSQIADATGKTSNNVAVLCHLGLKKLRQILDAEGAHHA